MLQADSEFICNAWIRALQRTVFVFIIKQHIIKLLLLTNFSISDY